MILIMVPDLPAQGHYNNTGETPDEFIDQIPTLADWCKLPTDDENEWHVQFWFVQYVT